MAFQPHAIVDSPQMRVLYHEAKGKEALSVRFWNPRLNQDFRFPSDIVAPEQLTSSRPGILDRVDTIVERWWNDRQRFSPIMIHEAKVEGSNVAELHEQTLRYAKTIVGEQFLGELFVLTTIGTKFRTWVFKARSTALHPLFGPPGDDRKHYIDAWDIQGSRHYSDFLDMIRAKTLPTVPTLPSQPFPPAPASAPGSPVVIASGSSPYPEPHWGVDYETVKLEFTNDRTMFNYTGAYTNITGTGPASWWTWSMNLQRWWMYDEKYGMYLLNHIEW